MYNEIIYSVYDHNFTVWIIIDIMIDAIKIKIMDTKNSIFITNISHYY